MSRFFLQFIPPLWLGLLFGISFIEAPLKFQAPGITLELGLGIGELVFGVLNKVELVLMVGLAICIYYQKNILPKQMRLIAGLLFIALLFQTVFLFPILNERIALIQAGRTPPDSSVHLFYVVGEGLKVVLLVFLAIKTYKLFNHHSQEE